jgi:opacity protein-like surface antigen
MKTFSKILLVSLLFFSANSYPLEVTPILGYRGGGEFIDETTNEKHTVVSSDMYGLIVSWPYERGKTYELYYSHQSSDLNSINITTPSPTGTANIPLTIDYLHIGGTAPISRDGGDLKTFVSGGLGFTYMSPDFTGLESDLRASFSLGIGLKYPLAKNIALRLETRGLATLFNSNSSIFCSGGCTLRVNGSMFFQAEVFAGIAVGF